MRRLQPLKASYAGRLLQNEQGSTIFETGQSALSFHLIFMELYKLQYIFFLPLYLRGRHRSLYGHLYDGINGSDALFTAAGQFYIDHLQFFTRRQVPSIFFSLSLSSF
jgi:hypothetical protein